LAKEKKRIKQQTQRQVKKLSSSHAILPEVKSIIDSIPEKEETYDLGNTLVSITSLDDQVYRNLPTIKEEDEEDESEDDDDDFSSKRKNKANIVLTDCEDDDGEDDELQKVARCDPFFNPINDDEVDRSDVSSEDERDIHYDPLAMLRKNTESSEPTLDQQGVTKAKLEREANRMLQQSEIYKKMQKHKQKKNKKFRLFRLQPTEDASGEKGPTATSKAGKGKKKSNNVLKSKHNQSQKRGKNRK